MSDILSSQFATLQSNNKPVEQHNGTTSPTENNRADNEKRLVISVLDGPIHVESDKANEEGDPGFQFDNLMQLVENEALSAGSDTLNRIKTPQSDQI